MKHAFKLPPQLGDVDEAVQALRALVEPVQGNQSAVAFEVAVSEALTNIVVHGYEGRANGSSISITLSVTASALELTIIDQAKPAPAHLYERAPLLDEIDFMQESGRGLALIRHHTDKVSYSPSSAGNKLVLTFPAPQTLKPNENRKEAGEDP